jgi:hypothetical protein
LRKNNFNFIYFRKGESLQNTKNFSQMKFTICQKITPIYFMKKKKFVKIIENCRNFIEINLSVENIIRQFYNNEKLIKYLFNENDEFFKKYLLKDSRKIPYKKMEASFIPGMEVDDEEFKSSVAINNHRNLMLFNSSINSGLNLQGISKIEVSK